MAGSIRKRGKSSWQVIVDLGRDPASGIRKRRFEKVEGSRRDAERRLTELLSERDRGIDIVPERLTVAEFLERWIRDYASVNVSASTLVRYTGIVRKHAIPAFGLLLLTKLRPLHLQSAYADWQEAGLSAKTVLHHHRMLHQAFAHAVDWQLLALNPAAAAKPPRAPHIEVEHLEPAAVTALLAKAAQYQEPWPTLIHVALATGARQGELLALRWQDVDPNLGEIRITRTARRFAGEGIVYGAPKTFRSRRPIRLDADTAALLRAHKARQNEERLAAGPAWTDNDLVFCEEAGGPIDAKTVLKWFQRIAAAAELGHVRFHALRHTAGTLMAAAGINARFIADRLGHANATFTINTYVHTTKDAEIEAAEAVAKVLRASG